MKKILNSAWIIFILFVLAQSAVAQDKRTLDTKIVDLLALLPTNNLELRDRLMQELVKLGDEGFQNVSDRMTPSGVEDNTAVVFAMNGLARYASQPGRVAQRTFAEKNFIRAMDRSIQAEVKKFYMRQLNLVGGEDAVKAVAPYLEQGELSEPAVFLLTSIHSELAIDELQKSLSNSDEKIKIPIIKALGELQVKAANGTILKLIQTENTDLKIVVLYALASIGIEESYQPLLKSAKHVGFSYDPTKAAESFIVYAQRLGENNELKLCSKACNEIIKLELAADKLHLKTAALEIYNRFFEHKAQPILLREFDNEDKAFRFSVLGLVEKSKLASVQSWISKAKQSRPEQKAEIITMLGNKKDNSSSAYITTLLSDPSDQVGEAAIIAYSKLKGKDAVPALTELLAKGIYPKHVADNLLLFIDEKKLDPIVALLEQAPEASKTEIIRIIGAKAGKRFFDSVYSYTNSTNAEIKSATFTALKNISSAKDIERLLNLLHSIDDLVMIKDIQDALVNAALETENNSVEIDLLLETLSIGPKRERIIVILPRIGGVKSLDAVSVYLNSSDVNERDAALYALINWRDHTASAKLFEVYKTASGENKSAALNGFLNQIGNSSLTDQQKLMEYEKMLAQVTSKQEKSIIIRSLAGVKSFDAFVRAASFLDDNDLKFVAANVAMEIALPTGTHRGLSGKYVRDILTKVLALNGFSGTESDYNKVKTIKYLAEMPAGNDGGNTLTEVEKAEGFLLLFDGISLDYWIGNKTDYLVEDGMIAVRPKQGGHGNLYTSKEYSNFIFRFEFQLTPGANSGLGIHAPLEGDAAYVGKELQIIDDSAPVYAQLQPYQYHGSVYGIIPAKRGSLKPVGEWNSQEVIVNGDHIKITLNGNVIVDGNVIEASKNGTADQKDHPGLLKHKGHIGFLGHGAELQFRNIRIKEPGKK